MASLSIKFNKKNLISTFKTTEAQCRSLLSFHNKMSTMLVRIRFHKTRNMIFFLKILTIFRPLDIFFWPPSLRVREGKQSVVVVDIYLKFNYYYFFSLFWDTATTTSLLHFLNCMILFIK